MTFNYKLISFTLSLILLSVLSVNVSAQTASKHPGLRTVVIDPGHGGKDPGALGKTKNVHEKHIVLSVSKLLGQKINAIYPDVKVIYTRTNDTFIGLHERAMIARRNNADLFISIHCNGSSNTEAKGSSVHILGQSSNNSRNKTDYFERNMSTAQRENAVIVLEDDYKTKYQSFDPNSPESYISHQLQWMAYYESSLLFASEVVENLIKKPLVPRRLVVDQDIFQVLVEANMPAVLLELAFVTNPTEYKYLSSADGQEQVAERLFQAFKSYKNKYDSSVNVQQVPTEVAPKTQEVPNPIVSEEVTKYYGVQVMGLGRQLKSSDPAFKGLDCHYVKAESSTIYKYIYGKFTTVDQARTALAEAKKKFPEAFIVQVEGENVKRYK
jgi:N-acetylmuramoyl-L-alanine amidase